MGSEQQLGLARQQLGAPAHLQFAVELFAKGIGAEPQDLGRLVVAEAEPVAPRAQFCRGGRHYLRARVKVLVPVDICPMAKGGEMPGLAHPARAPGREPRSLKS
jgi:hypothetical protein